MIAIFMIKSKNMTLMQKLCIKRIFKKSKFLHNIFKNKTNKYKFKKNDFSICQKIIFINEACIIISINK